MEIFTWPDRRQPATARIVLQRGDCDRGQCQQYAISISNGTTGMTVRFRDEGEFRRFIANGEIEVPDAAVQEAVANGGE